jgi:threonine dehydrogenase-like Zn-dependent dehydrogenase
MRATITYGAGDVRVENVPDARIVDPPDALLTVTHACICGSGCSCSLRVSETQAHGSRAEAQ